MSVPLRLRRPIVILGVVLSLVAGAATIRAAAAWTAASSPLLDRPPSVEALQASLAMEQARSADLLARLEELTAGSADLTSALDAAREQIAADAAQAQELQANLDAAKARLATLERSIRQARNGVAQLDGARAAGSVGASRAEDADDGEREEEHEDDDDD